MYGARSECSADPITARSVLFFHRQANLLSSKARSPRQAVRFSQASLPDMLKSGSERGGRTELQTLLDFLREGDTLVVTRIDRLARSMKDL